MRKLFKICKNVKISKSHKNTETQKNSTFQKLWFVFPNILSDLSQRIQFFRFPPFSNFFEFLISLQIFTGFCNVDNF